MLSGIVALHLIAICAQNEDNDITLPGNRRGITFDFLDIGRCLVGALLLVRVGRNDPDYSIFRELGALCL
jgi:hypothetical protein